MRAGSLALAQSRYCSARLKEEMVALGGRGASICCWGSPGVDTLFVLCSKEGEHKKELGQLVAAEQEWAVSRISPATELLGSLFRFHQLSNVPQMVELRRSKLFSSGCQALIRVCAH